MIQSLLGANAVMIIAYMLRSRTMPPQIPLFYSQLWGEGQLADSWLLVIVPLFMNLLIFLNGYISNRFFSDNVMIKRFFYCLDIFLIISFSAIFIKIILLVS